MIVALNGERVMSYDDAIAIIRSTRPGEQLAIDFCAESTIRRELRWMADPARCFAPPPIHPIFDGPA